MLRRISPIHKRGKSTPEQEELMAALQEAQSALDHAHMAFNDSTDAELVESCIFEIRALQSRINYLLRQMKELEAKEAAVAAAAGEGKRRWV